MNKQQAEDKPIDIKVTDLHTLAELETEYVVGHWEFNRELSEPEQIELLYLIQDNE